MDIIEKKIVQSQRKNNNGRSTIKSRYSTPKTTRPVNPLPKSVTKRTQSAERKRPPASPPATPVTDVSIPIEIHMGSRKLAGSRLPDSIWPSRLMRSLSVSFQSDTFFLPVRKIEKPVKNPLTDRTLKPSVNLSQRETATFLRKPTPERKRNPVDKRSENSKPVDSCLHSRLVDQHRWPSRNASNPQRKSSEKSVSEGIINGRTSKSSEKSVSEGMIHGKTSKSSEKSGSEGMINGNTSKSSEKSFKFGTRGISPSRIRPSSPTRQSNGSNSVLSFIADIKKGTKVANHIEDVHQLRLLYNGHLQWRFTNAQSDYSSYCQKIKAERTLYNVWRTTSKLRESVIEKRIELKQLRLKLKLYSILNEQMEYLNDWGLLEQDHVNALSGSIKDLQASTLHLPVTGGATADIETVKSAIYSAVRVMRTIGSTIGSVLSTVEGINYLVSELADVAARERAMLDEYEALLATTEAMQVKENSLKIHLLELQEQVMSI